MRTAKVEKLWLLTMVEKHPIVKEILPSILLHHVISISDNGHSDEG